MVQKFIISAPVQGLHARSILSEFMDPLSTDGLYEQLKSNDTGMDYSFLLYANLALARAAHIVIPRYAEFVFEQVFAFPIEPVAPMQGAVRNILDQYTTDLDAWEKKNESAHKAYDRIQAMKGQAHSCKNSLLKIIMDTPFLRNKIVTPIGGLHFHQLVTVFLNTVCLRMDIAARNVEQKALSVPFLLDGSNLLDASSQLQAALNEDAKRVDAVAKGTPFNDA